MNKKFWLTLIAIFVIAAMLLPACKPKEEATVAPEEPQAEVVEEAEVVEAEEVEEEPEVVEPTREDIYADVDPAGQVITFWHQHSRAREEALMEIVEDFNTTNEWGITVQAEYQGGYGDIFNKMLTFMNTEDVPNLVVAYQNQAATYQLGEALIDMDALVYSEMWGLSEDDRADFFPGFFYQDIFPSFGNMRLGFPPNRSMEVLYYNVDWLAELGYDAPPVTPAEFKEMACAATATPFSGALSEGSLGYQLSVDASRFSSWTFAHGGDMFDYETGQYSYDSDASVTAMSFLQDLFDEGCATIVVERYGDQTDFGQGRLLFTVGSSSGLPYYGSAVDEGAGFDWSVAPIPHTTDEPVMNIYGASVSIPKSSPEGQLAAWLFLKHYTNTETRLSGHRPPTTSQCAPALPRAWQTTLPPTPHTRSPSICCNTAQPSHPRLATTSCVIWPKRPWLPSPEAPRLPVLWQL